MTDTSRMHSNITRRGLIAISAALAVIPHSMAETADMEQAIQTFTGGKMPFAGSIVLDVAPLVENGNSVSVSVTVDHPMQPDNFVETIAIFNEKNPQPRVAEFHLTPRSGRAWVATRMRLATTQHLTAVAKLSDGRFVFDRKEVIVTIAACTEE